MPARPTTTGAKTSGDPADRRAQLRIPLDVPVIQYDGANEVEWRAQDISIGGGGIFLDGDPLPAVGTEMDIGFFLPGCDLEILAEGRVVWSNDPGKPDFDSRRQRGLGLKFRDLEPQYQKMLRAYVAEHLAKNPQPKQPQASAGPARPETGTNKAAPTSRPAQTIPPPPPEPAFAATKSGAALPDLPPHGPALPAAELLAGAASRSTTTDAELPDLPVPGAARPVAELFAGTASGSTTTDAELPDLPVPGAVSLAAELLADTASGSTTTDAELPDLPVPGAASLAIELPDDLPESVLTATAAASPRRGAPFDLGGIGTTAPAEPASRTSELPAVATPAQPAATAAEQPAVASKSVEPAPAEAPAAGTTRAKPKPEQLPAEAPAAGTTRAKPKPEQLPAAAALPQPLFAPPAPLGDPQEGEGGEGGTEERLAEGFVLGSYVIRRWLGSGGMGDVYLAEHTQLGRRVAIKRLRSEFARNRQALNRFFDEARAVNRIQHENIVQITDFHAGGEHVYCVMEFLEGQTLAQLHSSGSPLTLMRILHVAAQICDALDVAHQAGVIHRDLKPQNIMLLEAADGRDFVKLLDFGVAKLADRETKVTPESTGATLLGTPGYMSPEQLLGNPVDPRADLYALGVILYQMTSGTNPFVADTWGQAVVKHATFMPPRPSGVPGALRIPAELDQLILACLDKDPARRPQSAEALAMALRQLAGGGSKNIQAILPQVPKAAAPRRGRLALAAGLALMVVAGGIGTVVLLPRLEKGSSPKAVPPTADKTAQATARGVAPTSPPLPAVASAQGTVEPAGIPEPEPAEQPDHGAAPGESEAVEQPQTSSGSRHRDTAAESRRAGAAKKAPAKAGPTSKGAAAAKPEPAPQPAPVAKPEPAPKPTPVAKPEPPPKPAPAAEPAAAAAGGAPGEEHYEAGRQLLAENKALLAVQELEKCVKANPKHARAYKLIGKAYVLLGREDKAIEAFEKFVELVPGSKDSEKLRKIIEAYRNR